MKVKDLKEILEKALETLEQYEDDDNIKKETNTYFLDGALHFIGISGYNGGYINLSDLEEQINRDEEEDY